MCLSMSCGGIVVLLSDSGLKVIMLRLDETKTVLLVCCLVGITVNDWIGRLLVGLQAWKWVLDGLSSDSLCGLTS